MAQPILQRVSTHMEHLTQSISHYTAFGQIDKWRYCPAQPRNEQSPRHTNQMASPTNIHPLTILLCVMRYLLRVHKIFGTMNSRQYTLFELNATNDDMTAMGKHSTHVRVHFNRKLKGMVLLLSMRTNTQNNILIRIIKKYG